MFAIRKSRKDLGPYQCFGKGRWDHTGNRFAVYIVSQRPTLLKHLFQRKTLRTALTNSQGCPGLC